MIKENKYNRLGQPYIQKINHSFQHIRSFFLKNLAKYIKGIHYICRIILLTEIILLK